MKNKAWTESHEIPPFMRGRMRVFTSGPLMAIVSLDDGRFHLSVSCKDRYPTWDEIADARYDLLPHDIEAAMILPCPENYVNFHPYTFHLWEIHDPELPIDRDSAGDRRTRMTLGGLQGAEAGRG